MKILCTHNNGGVGKTTLAIHAVGVLRSQLGRLLLIDCDDQADSWQFYVDRLPNDQELETVDDRLSVISNSKRKSIKKIAKKNKYDRVVLDMDSPLSDTVQAIIQDNPDIVLIPVNKSQEVKALRNLPRTLEVIYQMELNLGFQPEVKVVPLGVARERVVDAVENSENLPTNCKVATEMPDVQEQMQTAIYADRKYIWEYPGYEDLLNYFLSLLGL